MLIISFYNYPFFIIITSIRMTSMGWFHVARAPPTEEANILSKAPRGSVSDFPRTLRIESSARRAKPILHSWNCQSRHETEVMSCYRDPQFVHWRTATALTPLFTPASPSFLNMSMKTAKVDGGLTPEVACFVRVISAVFMQVVNPTLSMNLTHSWALGLHTHGRVCLCHTSSHTSQETG